MGGATGQIALATVTSRDFLPGTMVMLHSFLRHNKWFDGDLVIIQSDLDLRGRTMLTALFERVRFVEPRPRLCHNIDLLVAAKPDLDSRKSRFHSIEAIGLGEYDHVLFCDSDILFRACVQDLFRLPSPMVCCGDGPFYRGAARHPDTFAEVPNTNRVAGLQNTFNAGFMLMGRTIRTPDNLDALIDMINADRWSRVVTGHTDQLLYNIHFEGQQHIVGPEYNFMLLHRKDIRETRLEDAKVLHFNGPAKPWNPAALIKYAQRDLALTTALRLWNAEFTDIRDHFDMGVSK